MSTANPPDLRSNPAPDPSQVSVAEPKRGRGRPKKTEEEKAQSRANYRATKKRRLDKRRELLQSMRDSGQLSASEADKLAREFGVDLPPDGPAPTGVNTADSDVAQAAEGLYSSVSDMSEIGDNPSRLKEFERKGSRGPMPTWLNDQQKKEFLYLLSQGVGRYAACRTMGLGIHRVILTMKVDAGFKMEVITAERAREDMCDSVVYSAAMGGDVSAAISYSRIFRTSRQANIQQKLQVETFKLQKRQVEAQIGALAETSHKPNFSGFTREEFDEYNRLLDKAQSGGTLSFDETAAFGRFTARILSGGSGAGGSAGAVQTEPQPAQPALPAPPELRVNVIDVPQDPSEAGSTHAEMGNQVAVDAKDAL